MKKIRFSGIILAAAILFTVFSPSVLALDDPQIDCYSAVLVEVDGDQVNTIYTKNENDLVYPASLTKLMTILLAVEAVENGQVSLSDQVTAQPGLDFDLIDGGTMAWIGIGEVMTLEDLLYCAAVQSANDACNVIAEYIGGNISNFVGMMNARAASLGCTNTVFVNAHGLPNSGHYTTAADFMKILREAAKHELVMEFCNTVTYTVPATNISDARQLTSTNSLINPDNPMYPGDYLYEYAKGMKTGHTNDAGYCLASTAEKDGVILLSVVFNGQAIETEGNPYYQHFADSITLFDWGFDNFSTQEIVKSTEIVENVPVEMGADGDTVAVRPATSISAYLPNDIDMSTFTRTITLNSENGGEALQAPISAGQAVGEITVSRDGVVYGKATLITSNSVDLSRVEYMRTQIGDTLRKPVVIISVLILLLLIGAYLTIVLRYRAKRKAYQKRLDNARKMHFEMEAEEDEVRYERRVKASRPTYSRRNSDVVLEPEERPAEEAYIDEPTRIDMEPLPVEDEPTRISAPISDVFEYEPAEETFGEIPAEESEDDQALRDYFESFFEKK